MARRTALTLPIRATLTSRRPLFSNLLVFFATMHATPSAALLHIMPTTTCLHRRCFKSASSALKASDTTGSASAPKKRMYVRETENGNPKSIWFNSVSVQDTVVALMKPLKITGEERIYDSFGPAEYTDEYYTPDGDFIIDVSLEPEDFSGTSIQASSTELMRKIVKVLDDSGKFRRS